MYSVQQIKFDCLAYIKEHGGDPAGWQVLQADGTGQAVFSRCGVDQARDIWMCKPALSAKAALTVVRFLRERMGVTAPEQHALGDQARFVLLFRRG